VQKVDSIYSEKRKWAVLPSVLSLLVILFLTAIFLKPHVLAKVSEFKEKRASIAAISPTAESAVESTATPNLASTNDVTPITVPTPTPTPAPEPLPTPPPKVLGSGSAKGQVFYGSETPNNKFGMYVHNIVDDIKASAKLINSNGGDWGYILLTMDIADRNKSGWQDMFDAASKSHLIPIVQLFNNGKCDPKKMDFEALAKMLNDLKWPSKHRYISVFNEVNAKDYWCEKIAPDEYARALDKAIKAFRGKSTNFFIMPAAFNSSARTQGRYLSEDSYLIAMNKAVPGIFTKIDGWASHSYPHPNFSGDINNLPANYGARDTINNYTWELALLKTSFGVNALPVFITETGWLHREGQDGCEQYSQAGLLSATTASTRFKDAYINYWLEDPRVVAITPFIFKSKDPCAAGFAWQKKDGGWYPQAEMLMAIPKTAGSSN
jgi:hypothetical protein